MKAIETVYKGYKFRSRLEARWAVFFDRCDVKWEYEKEGYDLGKSGKYLPDFFLPDNNMFVEVKGEMPNNTEEYCDKLRELRESDNAVLLVIGLPTDALKVLFAWELGESSGGVYENEVSIVGIDDGKLIFRRMFDTGNRKVCYDSMFTKEIPTHAGVIDYAFIDAKQARFEFSNKR